MENLDKHYFKNNYVKLLIIVCVLFNVVGLFFPILRNDDPTLYASIAKNIVLSNNWVYLTQPLGVDWLDKPHLQFWVTAISYKLFGINSFAYTFPGFLFNLLGAYFTYRLGRYLFNRPIGLLSALIYLSAFHLLLSSTTDVRAEVYLMGLITPACYYYLKFFTSKQFKLSWGVSGSIATACAIMVKGLFVLSTIGSGVLVVFCYELFCRKTISFHGIIIKLITIILMITIFITPELMSLYLQFDAHPEKVIFSHTNVSGIKWFLWDSLFGRFFGTGPITRSDTSYGHYFFFIHTFLWAFLPWSLVFIISIWCVIKNKLINNNYIFLLGSFFITFILFSLTSFQLDYYTNILMPFSAIMSAAWFYRMYENYTGYSHPMLSFQMYLAYFMTIVILIGGVYVLSGTYELVTLILGIIIIAIYIIFIHHDILIKAILYPCLAINYIFVVLMLIYGGVYAKYDVGYQVANYINNQSQKYNVIDYQLHSLTLEFYLKNTYNIVGGVLELDKIHHPYYIVTEVDNIPQLQEHYNNSSEVTIEKYFLGATIDEVIKGIINKNNIEKSAQHYVLLKVN